MAVVGSGRDAAAAGAASPQTTGRRVWALTWRLILPWAVCGGLLWALVTLTPDYPSGPNLTVDDLPAGLSIEVADFGAPYHPFVLYGHWNLRARAFGQMSVPAGEAPMRWQDWRTGVGWLSGTFQGERFAEFLLSFWWLLPFPLLWSGFNVWRWVRHGEAR